MYANLYAYIMCRRAEGKWKVWKNRSGGITGCIRTHMISKHGPTYRSKCQEEGVTVRELNQDDPDSDDSEFTLSGLIDRLARWIAVDDQVGFKLYMLLITQVYIFLGFERR